MKRLANISLKTKITIAVFFAYFAIGMATLPHYGINWDTINHLPRGQAYLDYFLTGEKKYESIPEYEKHTQDPTTLFVKRSKEVPRTSLYQNRSFAFEYFIDKDGGHPPTSDIISSIFNKILFQKLGLINDIDSYRTYGIFLSAILVALIFWWTATKTNIFGGLVATLSIVLYPLFWSESHFNTEKDVPETVYISLLLFSVWQGINKRSAKWILASGIFFGLALGTKFNVIFVTLIVVPWLIYYLLLNVKRDDVSAGNILKQKWLIVSVAIAPLIGFVIFVAFWPYLWTDVLTNLGSVLEFYKQIGTASSFNPRFVGVFGINYYPAIWISITTPLIVLFLAVLGIIFSTMKLKIDRSGYFGLLLLWLLIPVARVSVPGTSLYGGVRQIMEYIPALAMLSGVGAYAAREKISQRIKVSRKNLGILGVLLFLPIAIKLITIHPNENVYFNVLVGGLNGAKERNIPYWGNTFGGAYRQGLVWLNKNAEKDANVVYVYELIPNIPSNWFREDFTVWNVNRSGYLMQGEYAITLIHDGTSDRSYYDKYLEKFVKPSYQVQVDGVPILKVWQNTAENQIYDLGVGTTNDISIDVVEDIMIFDFGRSYPLRSLSFDFEVNSDCTEVGNANIYYSEDSVAWLATKGTIPSGKLAVLRNQPNEEEGTFLEPFTGEKARYVKMLFDPLNSCVKNISGAEVTYYTNFPDDLSY